MREPVTVIGAGVSGLTAAYLLQRRYDVTLFDTLPRLGGHAHTHDIATSDATTIRVDTGFIVHNERTYPHLLKLFRELGVRTQDAEMSMSVRCQGCGLEYAGGKQLAGLFPCAGQVLRVKYLRTLLEVVRFHRHARNLLSTGDDETTLGAFIERGGYSRYFVDHFALPLVSAVWSADERISRDYPAGYLFRFLHNHGLLRITGSPQWKTVVGGSRTYVERIADRVSMVHSATPVRLVRRHFAGVEVIDAADVVHTADRVVIATHADEALALLADATAAEKQVLGAFDYSDNSAWLHTDPSLLPRARGARASWNYLKPACRSTGRVLVSYHTNRLMQLSEPLDYVVTLNGDGLVDPATVIGKMTYRHPIYTPKSVAAQRKLAGLTSSQVAYAGAYHGWGFHEDGCVSGVRAAEAFGVTWS